MGGARDREYQERYEAGDTTIDECLCGTLYKNEKKIKNSNGVHWEIYEECLGCRRKGINQNVKIVYGTQGHGEQKKELKKDVSEARNVNVIGRQNLKQKILKIGEINTPTTQSTEQDVMPGVVSGRGIIEKSLTIRSANKGPAIKRDTMKQIEKGTQETKRNIGALSTKEGEGAIQPMDSQNLSIILSRENSGSIKLLDESARHLIDLGREVTKKFKGDFGDEVIRAPHLQNIETAISCAIAANSIMRTKLEYIKEGRSLIKGI